MHITLNQVVNTVAWQEGEQNAPAAIVTSAKELSNKGYPTAFARLIIPDTKESDYPWCVLTADDKGLRIALQAPPNAT